MSKCQTCRDKDAELLTRWERTRNWLFLRVNHVLFPQDFDDLRADRYTQGFSDGNVQGVEKERERSEKKLSDYMDMNSTQVNTEDIVRQKMDAMLSPIDTNKIVAFDKRAGAIYIGGERAEEGRLVGLKSEAEAIEQFELWHLIKETPKELAQREMFVSGDNMDAMKKGRSMLYTLDTQQRIIDTFKSYQQKKGT